MKKLSEIRHLTRHDRPEAFWSKSYAEAVAAKIEADHPDLICAVDHTLYCDGTRDWSVHTYYRAA